MSEHPDPPTRRSADFRRYLAQASLRFLGSGGLAKSSCPDLIRASLRQDGRVEPGHDASREVRTAHAGGRMRRLDWDSEFFGVPAGRIEGLWRDPDAPAHAAWSELVPALLAAAAEQGLVFLDARIAAEELALAQALEMGGFRLVDALSIYLHHLRRLPKRPPQPCAIDIEGFLRDALRAMEWGRLFAEPRVPRAKAEEFYLRTSLHYLARGAALTVVRDGTEPAGVAIGVADEEGSRLAGARLGQLWLFIVAPGRQGKGVGKRLFNQFCAEFSSLVDVVEIGTQIQHGAANRIYRSAGALPVAHALTFHRWAG